MTEELKTLYNDNVIVQIVTLPMSVSPRLIRKTRSLLQDDTVRAATVFFVFFFSCKYLQSCRKFMSQVNKVGSIRTSISACLYPIKSRPEKNSIHFSTMSLSGSLLLSGNEPQMSIHTECLNLRLRLFPLMFATT